MRSIFGYLLINIFFANCLQAQNDNSDTLDSKTFHKVLNQQFTNLVTGNAKNSIGNYAALKITEPEVSFAGSAIIDSTKILTVKASGGISDNLFAIFNNSTLNTNVSLEFQFHAIKKHDQSLSYLHQSLQKFKTKQNQLLYQMKRDSIKATFGTDSMQLVESKNKLLKNQKDLEELFKTVNNTHKDSVEYQMQINSLMIDSVEKEIKNVAPLRDRTELITNEYEIAVSELKPDIAITGFILDWFSFGYKVRNDAFKLFNPKLVFESQIQKESFVSHEANIQYSKYSWSNRSFRSYYLNFGLSFSYSHNLNELKKTDIKEVKNYGFTPNERTSTIQYSVYEGAYQKDLKGFKIYGDYYRFLFKDNIAAVHAFPEVDFKEQTKPTYNCGFGFLLSFMDENNNSSKVNAELYYKFLDISNQSDSDQKLFERNEIGLRFSIPIKFKNN